MITMPTAARTALLGLVATLVLGAAWFLAPAALGGSTTYLSTHGTSMEPGFRTGRGGSRSRPARTR